MKTDQLIAEALVDGGLYSVLIGSTCGDYGLDHNGDSYYTPATIQYKEDTLEGYRQLITCIDWLKNWEYELWLRSITIIHNNPETSNFHEALILRVSWCFTELAKDEYEEMKNANN